MSSGWSPPCLRGCRPQVQKSSNWFDWSRCEVTRCSVHLDVRHADREKASHLSALLLYTWTCSKESSKIVEGDSLVLVDDGWGKCCVWLVVRLGQDRLLGEVHKWVSLMALWSSMRPSGKKQKTEKSRSWIRLSPSYPSPSSQMDSTMYIYFDLLTLFNFAGIQMISEMCFSTNHQFCGFSSWWVKLVMPINDTQSKLLGCHAMPCVFLIVWKVRWSKMDCLSSNQKGEYHAVWRLQ